MPVWELFVVLFLILLNGFFAMSELAIVSSRRVRLEQMAKSGNRGAAKALRLSEDPTGFLSTVQVGITLIGIVAGAYSGATFAGPLSQLLDTIPAIARWSDPIAFALVIIVTTYLSLIAGELVPKRLAMRHAEGIAAFVAGPMTWLAAVGKPVVWFLRLSTETVLRLLRVDTSGANTVTEEEVKAMIAEGTESGVFEVAERELIEGVLRFADRPVRVIMVPRRELAWLTASDPMDMVLEKIRAHSHSRYPLRAQDGSDEVLGVVHVRDVIGLVREGGGGDLLSIAKQPIYVSADMPSLKLLEQFRGTPVHMAIAVDEYGDLEGVVTPTDVLISIAGDVPDSPHDDPDAVQREDGSWLLDAGMAVDEVADLLDVDHFGGHGYATLAGFVLEQMRRIPSVGESFTAFGWRFEVVDMDGRRIDKILAERAEAGRAAAATAP